ncbi:MAG: inositol monophosphatase family protein, partial [Candidatus Binatia bacterium]
METGYLEKEKRCAIAAAREAGAIILTIYNTNYTVDYKDKHQNSPVTIADRDANHRIHEILQGGFPDYGWLS